MPRSDDNPYQSPSVETATEARDAVVPSSEASDSLALSALVEHTTNFGMGLSLVVFIYGVVVLFASLGDSRWGDAILSGGVVTATLVVFSLCWLMTRGSLAALTLLGVAAFLSGIAGDLGIVDSALRGDWEWRRLSALVVLGLVVNWAFVAAPLRMLRLAWGFQVKGGPAGGSPGASRRAPQGARGEGNPIARRGQVKRSGFLSASSSSLARPARGRLA